MTHPLEYRTATWRPVPMWRRAWPLVWQEATVLFRSKWGVALFFFCLLPAFVRLAMLLILFGVVNFGPAVLRNRSVPRGRNNELATIDPARVEFYIDPVLQVMPGMVFVLLVSTLVVARAIARDRTTNGLELYWTRGISPWGYLLGKWLGCALIVGALTVLAPLALWLTACFLAEDWSLLLDTALPFARALLGLVVATLTWTALGVLVSASCATPTAAMVLWAMLLVGTSSIGVVAAAAARAEWLRSCLSVWDAGGVVARAIAGVAQRDASVLGACATLAGLLVLLFAVARRHLRVTEALQ